MFDEIKCYLDEDDVTLADIHNHIEELKKRYKDLVKKGYRDAERGINV